MSMRTLRGQIEWYRKAQWSLCGVILLASICFYVFGYMPGHRQQFALAKRAGELQGNLLQVQAKTANLPNMELSVENLRMRLERFNKQLPQQREMGSFHNDIATLMQQSNLKRPNTKPGLVRQSALFSEMPITLSFEGDFPAVCDFLKKVEGMQRLTCVRSINVRATDAQKGLVSVQMVMSIFYSEG
jgi:Tfp pilus assembly protein PilO